MATPVVFGDHKFESRNQCVKACKKIIARYQMAQVLKIEDQIFFAQLFTLHPDYEEKAGCGIKAIRYGYDPEYGTRCLIIVRYDGTETTISWGNCLQSPKKKYRVEKAFRNASACQVNAFKARTVLSPVFCFISGERLGLANSRVVYNAELSFNELVGQFLRSLSLEYADIVLQYGEHFGELNTVSVDENLASKWCAYHEEKAVMTLVSADLGIFLNKSTNQLPPIINKADIIYG